MYYLCKTLKVRYNFGHLLKLANKVIYLKHFLKVPKCCVSVPIFTRKGNGRMSPL